MRSPRKSKFLIRLLAGVMGTGWFLMQTPAWAADPGANPVKAKNVPAVKGEAKKQQVLRFDALTIMGEAAQPQVYYLLNRKQIIFKHEPVKKDLVEQIRKTVEDEPF